jgi:hypothetical protein
VIPASPPVTFGDLATQAIQAISTWKALGTFAGLTAIVNLLTNCTKYPQIDQYLKGQFWLRPLISIVLGALSALIAALSVGANPFTAVISGILAGLSGTGLHELVTSWNERIQAERAAGAKIVTAMKASDSANALTQITDLSKALTGITSIPDSDDRITEIARWANSHPPT